MTGSNISAQIDAIALMTCNVTSIPPGATITYQWRREDMSPISTPHLTVESLFLPRVNVSDAGVYICEVTASDSESNPHVISQSVSVNITLTVASKEIYLTVVVYFLHFANNVTSNSNTYRSYQCS